MKQISQTILLVIMMIQPSVMSSCKNTGIPDPLPDKELPGILATLEREHPRLLLTDARLQELKAMSLHDNRLKDYATEVVGLADKDLIKQPIEHVLVGPRLLDKSRECLSRVYNLAFAYRWTGDEKYLSAAISNLRNVCTFPDWNPSHFLDVAEMSHAVAIGYDWLYGKMDQPTRTLVKDGLIALGLHEGKKAYTANAWWTKDSYNWNQVCNSGLLIGALAVAETDQDLALFILPEAIENLPHALKSYGPDGVWCEGPGYWDYATNYTAYGIAALQTALGDDFGLTGYTGMSTTGYFPIYSAGPSGYMLNYADVGEKSKLAAPHAEMWLAGVFNNDHFSDFVHDQLATRTAKVWDIIWYRPYANSAAKRDQDRFFDGKVALWFSRSSWDDTNAIWVGFKAGYNKVNHGHLDLGNFEMDALGVRWARDLGSDDYNLPGYFSGSNQNSQRWTYYRLNSFSHNVPVINGNNQNVDATSKFISHGEGVSEPYAVVDFTEAYKGFASSARRGIKLSDGKKSLLVQDEFTLTKPGQITWGMTTDAAILVVDAKQAELTSGGRKLTAKILSPANAQFSTGSAQQASPQKTNNGVNRLLVQVPTATGNVTITVLLSPRWTTTPSEYTPEVIPLEKWPL